MGQAAKFLRSVYLVSLPLALGGIVILLVINIPSIVVMLSLIAFIGVFVVGCFVTIQTLLQQAVVDAYRGRVLGAFNTVMSVAMMPGLIVASTLGDSIGIVPLFDSVGVIYFVSAAIAFLMLRSAKIGIEKPASAEVAI